MGERDAIDVMLHWFPGVVGILALALGCLTAYGRSRALAAAGPLELRTTRPVARALWLWIDIIVLGGAVLWLAGLLMRGADLWRDLPTCLLMLGVLVATLPRRLIGAATDEIKKVFMNQ